jgi:hypothetical protein
VFGRTLRRVLAFTKANTLNHIRSSKPVREAKINQHAHQDSGSYHIQEGGMTRY